MGQENAKRLVEHGINLIFLFESEILQSLHQVLSEELRRFRRPPLYLRSASISTLHYFTCAVKDVMITVLKSLDIVA